MMFLYWRKTKAQRGDGEEENVLEKAKRNRQSREDMRHLQN